MKRNHLPGIRGALVAVSILLLSACASMGKPPEEVVQQRAQERWDILLADDLEGAYGYFSPGYRSGLSLKNYQRKLLTQQVQWTSAEVLESNCSSTSCKVKILIYYTVYGAVPGVRVFKTQSTVTEDWILVDGKWYFLPVK